MNIADVKRSVRISEVVRDLGGVISTGYPITSWAPCTCPFHDDRTPSASVNDTVGKFICHGCDVRGDVIDLVRAAGFAHDVPGAIAWIKTHYIGVRSGSDTPTSSTTAASRGNT